MKSKFNCPASTQPVQLAYRGGNPRDHCEKTIRCMIANHYVLIYYRACACVKLFGPPCALGIEHMHESVGSTTNIPRGWPLIQISVGCPPTPLWSQTLCHFFFFSDTTVFLCSRTPGFFGHLGHIPPPGSTDFAHGGAPMGPIVTCDGRMRARNVGYDSRLCTTI